MADLSLKAAGRLAPPGTHEVLLESITEVLGAYAKPVWHFVFVVADGEHESEDLIKVTGTTLRPNNSLGKLAAQLLGRDVRRLEEVDFAQFIRRRYRVTALPYANGGEGADIVKIEALSD